MFGVLGRVRAFLAEPALREIAGLGAGQAQVARAIGQLGTELAALRAQQDRLRDALVRIEARQGELIERLGAQEAGAAGLAAQLTNGIARAEAAQNALRDGVEAFRERATVQLEIGQDRMQLVLEAIEALQLRP
jgi:chromosome segregation ATPase